MKLLGKILDYFEESLIILMMAYMAIMNFLNVVFRYCFASSFSFTEELTVTVFVWVTMLGIAAGFKRYAHLGMSFVVDLFHGKAKAMFALFGVICSLVFMVFVFYFGIEMVQGQINMGSTTPVLRMPQAVQGLSMPVGAIFIIIRILQAGFLQVKGLWNEDEQGGTQA
ncbi:TRAP transporter small permease [Anaerotignum sp. MB30-C6]|uniref:TRAP transporter small permease n=1 Tax=Anaerotignum sp. MB30-C6 TaxID=3070814 RepID=UPI0027DB59FC|nr:TRAP transporter small permease [Anaerotignum sp. MB30-C6]WMI81776.1 TRAP transporter small permease [Anaerotignum sp. MB30-C6]